MRGRIGGTTLVSLVFLIVLAIPALAAQWAYFSEWSGGQRWGAWAIQYSGTYDGDGVIAAKVDDDLTDGSCVSALYRDGGVTYNQATSCSSWVNHLFYDQTGNSSSDVRIDRTHADPVEWRNITGY